MCDKKNVSAGILAAGVMSTTMIPVNVYAHGFVEKPISRAALCNESYGSLNLNCGNAMYEPQSLKAPQGFPNFGPVDGKIASAGGLFEGVLDHQTTDRWFKNGMKGGRNTFTWKYTQAHFTNKWNYYITKKGWDPNKPLTRADFELISTVQHDGSQASNNLTHTVNVPTDRSGYHVILAVWDVADTPNAFYNVIDVNLVNNITPDTEAPNRPTNLQVTKATSNSIELNWTASTDNVSVKEYEVFRDGKMIGTVLGPTITDKELMPNTKYKYTIKAVDAAGNVSEESQTLIVSTTDKAPDTETPTQPTTLHTMGITSSSVELMWSASNDNVAVEHYYVYRETPEGQKTKVGTSKTTSFKDKNLHSNTTYKYTVTAVDLAENESVESKSLTVTTKEAEASYEQWNPSKSYEKGDKVEHQGKIYEAVQSYQGKGDPNWIDALSLWRISE